MTEDTSPENLRKFLESDDPALVRMGLSMAKGSGVPDELLPIILRFYMWNEDKTIRAAAKSVFNKHAPAEIQAKLKENWKPNYRTLPLKKKQYNRVRGGGYSIEVINEKLLRIIQKLIKSFKSNNNLVYIFMTPYIKSLSNDDANIAAKALGEIGDKCAVEPLIEALEDDNQPEWVHSSAVEALGKIGGVRAVNMLIKSLKNDDLNLLAAEALGNIGDKRAVEPLIKALKKDGSKFQTYCINQHREINICKDALKKLGHEVE